MTLRSRQEIDVLHEKLGWRYISVYQVHVLGHCYRHNLPNHSDVPRLRLHMLQFPHAEHESN